MNDQEKRAKATELTNKLVDAGKLIEAGWMGYRILCVPDTAGQAQIDDTRIAFYAGAQHLFGSIMTFLDKGEDDEATEDDLRKMELVAKELRVFTEELQAKIPGHKRPL